MDALTGRIQLDFRSGEPLYLQIVRQIELMVAEGQLQKGDQLPTVRELATDLRINFNTVARAYHVLDEAGLISTQRGRGTYIWEEPDQEMIKKLKEKTIAELASEFLRKCQELGWTAEEALQIVQQQALLEAQNDHTAQDETKRG